MGHLRGREAECAELSRLIVSAAGGAGGVVIVEGAAGIGKSRLLAEAARIASADGLQVAAAACDELDQVTPWAPLLRALSATSPVLVSETDLAPVRTLADQRLAVIDCIRSALEQASRRQPLLITLDDLQWADPATLLAVGSLTRQLFSFPVAWLLAQRPLPASSRRQSLATRLAEAGASRLHLRPLGDDAARAMAADMAGAHADAGIADLIARAAGHPLYLIELLQSSGGPAIPLAGAGTALSASPVPASLRSAIAAHLRSLSEPTRDLLKVASVLGLEFSVSELEGMTGQQASQLMAPLEQALTAEVLTEQDDRLAFRHDLLRQAVYQDIAAPLRRGLHRDAATTLLAQKAPIVRVATHLALGAQPGDEQAIAVLAQAITELSPTSASAAADLSLRVLGLTEPDDPRRAGLVATTVGLLGWASRVDEARAAGEDYLRDHPQPARVEAEIQHGMRRAWARTTHAPYPAPLPTHLVTDPAVPARTRADLIAFEQVGAMWQAPAGHVSRALHEASGLIGDGGEASLNVLRNVRIALAHEHGHLLEAMQTARSGPHPIRHALPGQGGGQSESAVAFCLCAVGRPREAFELLAQGQQAAQASGDTFVVVRCQVVRALALLELGRLDDARAEAEAAARSAEDLGLEYYLSRALSILAETSGRQGDLGAANAAADRLTSCCPPDAATGDQCWAAALCADARGRPDAALAALAPVMERLGRGRLYFAAWDPSRLPYIAGLAIRAGDPPQAGVVARAAAELSRRNPGLVPAQGAEAHARGLRQSDPASLSEAVRLLGQGERPLATAAAEEDLGRTLARAGRKDDAVAAFEAAYAAYLAANASRDLARVRGALHALGVRKRRATVARPDHGWASLTSGELAVVEVVAEGCTNREAAAQLYLSADTVNTHLRHAFAKLGIRSRVELARLALSRQPEHQPRAEH